MPFTWKWDIDDFPAVLIHFVLTTWEHGCG